MTSDPFRLSKTLQNLTLNDDFQSGNYSSNSSRRLQSTDNKFLFSSPTRNQKVSNLSPVSQSILKDVFLKTGSSQTIFQSNAEVSAKSPQKEPYHDQSGMATRDSLFRCLKTLETEHNPALKTKAIEQLYHNLELWYPLLDLEIVRSSIETICKNLQFYQKLNEQFILFGVYIIKHLLRIEMIMLLMDNSNCTSIFSVDLVVSVLNLLLHDSKLHKSIHLAVARTFLSAPIGEYGMDALVKFASSTEYGELVQDILTLMANDPHVQRNAVTPMVVQEMAHTDVNSKLSALRALSKLYTRAEEGLPALLDELTTGYLQRHLVAKTIRTCGLRGEKVLTHLLKNHQNFRIRVCAAQGLGSTKFHEPIKQLQIIVNEGINSTLNTPSPGPRRYILLKSVKALEEHQELYAEPIFEDDPYALKTYLQDGLPPDYEDILLVDFRQFLSFICKSLEQGKFAWNDPNRVHAKIPWSELKGFPFEEMEENTLQYKTSEETIQALCVALKDDSPEVRRASADALGSIGPPQVFSAVQHLAKTLKDAVPEVRASAALAISKIGDATNPTPELMKNLQEMLKDNIWKVRFAACKAIGSLGEKAKQFTEDLLRVFVQGTVERTHVAMVLVNLGQKAELALVDVLLQQVTKYGSQIRIAAAYGLSAVDILNIPSSRADTIVEKLFEASGDSRPIIRSAVISSLGALARKANERIGYLKSASLLSFFYTFLKDKDKVVREAAAQLLARNRTGDAGELLLIQGALKETNPVIRSAAVHGLYWVGTKSLRTVLLAMNDISPSVRKESCRTLTAWSFSDIIKSIEKRSNAQKHAVIVAVNEILSIMENATEDLGFAIGIETFLRKLKKALESLPGNIVHNYREYSPSKAASPIKSYLGSSLYNNSVDEIHMV